MSRANELTQQILTFLFDHRVFAWRASSTGIFDNRVGKYRSAPKCGVADVLACYRGKLLAFEIKTGKDRLSTEQTGFIKSINRAGGYACVIKTFDEFIGIWDNKINAV